MSERGDSLQELKMKLFSGSKPKTHRKVANMMKCLKCGYLISRTAYNAGEICKCGSKHFSPYPIHWN